MVIENSYGKVGFWQSGFIRFCFCYLSISSYFVIASPFALGLHIFILFTSLSLYILPSYPGRDRFNCFIVRLILIRIKVLTYNPFTIVKFDSLVTIYCSCFIFVSYKLILLLDLSFDKRRPRFQLQTTFLF